MVHPRGEEVEDQSHWFEPGSREVESCLPATGDGEYERLMAIPLPDCWDCNAHENGLCKKHLAEIINGGT